jgi:hypothetical protein
MRKIRSTADVIIGRYNFKTELLYELN